MRTARLLPALLLVLGTGVNAGAASDMPEVTASARPPTNSPPVRAYEGSTLTLPQAVEEAIARHPDVSALQARADAAAIRSETERFLMPPMAEAQVFQWPLDTWRPGDAQLMFTLGQDLPGPGKRLLRAARAGRQAAVVAARADVRAVEIAEAVKQAYADLWSAREALGVYQASASLLRDIADVAHARYATGRITQQDVLKAIVERSRIEEEIVTAGERAAVAEARLLSLLQRPPDTSIGVLADPDDAVQLPALSSVLTRALETHPELAMASREIESADAGIAVARSERGPDYVVRGGFMVMPGMTNAWTAAVGVTWPSAPWARRRVDAMLGEATAERVSADAERRAVETRVRLMVHEAWVRARAAQARVELLRTSILPQTEHALEIARIGYQSDRLGFMDLLDAQRLLLDSRLDLQRSVADRETALAALERAVGSSFRWDGTATHAIARTAGYQPAASPRASAAPRDSRAR